MFRQDSLSRAARRAFGFLIVLLLATWFAPFQISAAPRAQAVDVCALMPPGAASTFKIPTAASAPQFQGGCQATYRTGVFIGTNQAEVMLMAHVQIWSPSDIARQRVMQCSMVAPGSGTCIAGVGEVGADFTDKPPGTYWWADSARGCFWFRTSSDYSADPAVIAQGRTIQKRIDDKLKTLPPCPGMPTPIPAQLNVGIGGNYDEPNERVNVTADVTQRPNVGIGDDFYEWTLDGAPIRKGKELKSIEYDTTNLAQGEHEIVVKVTDIPNNVTGGATYKFTVTRKPSNPPPPNASNAAQVTITTPTGTQPINSGTKTQATLQSGKAEIQARCEAVVYGLLTYVLYKEGDDPDSMYMKSKALGLAIMVQAYCDKLLARAASSDALARPAGQALTQNAGALIEIEVQQGAGQFEITHDKAVVSLETATARVQTRGKQALVVGYNPDSQSTLVRALNGTVHVAPTNNSLAPVTLQAGQAVVVTVDRIGDVLQTPNAPSKNSVPGATLAMPPFGATEPYPSVNGRTIQFAQRRVPAGETVLIPVWLMNAKDIANINAEMTFDANVARPEGTITKGYVLDNALFRANANESGIVRMGFAQATNLANGTGAIAYLPFRAVGKPGERTTLTANVTSLNNANGDGLSMDRINGEIVILNQDGTLPGDNGTNALPLGACSGKTQLTELDALCALEISVQLRPSMRIMDVDGDGAIDSRDAALILTRVMGRR